MKKFRVITRYSNNSKTIEATRFRKKWMEKDFYFYRGLRRVAYVTHVESITVLDSE